MTMKVWLDDERLAPDGWVRVCTASEAISLIQSGQVDCISLDHDLGPDSAGTGYDVALFIEQAAFDGSIRAMQWVIHSANPVGVGKMTKALQNADRFWGRSR